MFERLGGNHHARCVYRAVSRHALEPLRDLKDFAHPLIFPCKFVKTRLGLDRILERNVEHVGHELGDAIDIGKAHVEHPADVLDGRARLERVEGDDLGDLLASVLLGYVLNDLAAPVHAEIDVDIRHADALGI